MRRSIITFFTLFISFISANIVPDVIPARNSVEQSFAMIKPTAVKENHSGEIIAMIEKSGLKLIGLKMTKMTKEDAAAFYSEHKEKPFFADLIHMMSSGPIVCLVVEGDNAVSRLRDLVGATNPEKALDGTIRKLFGKNITENAIHASDSIESVVREIPFFFSPRELFPA